MHKLTVHVRAAVVAAVAAIVVVACSPTPPPPTTVPTAPPGTFDITKGLVSADWKVGTPVRVPLWAPGTGANTTFTVLAGFLPSGVSLTGGMLVGTPDTEPLPLPDGSTFPGRGLWQALVRATGDSGSATATIYGLATAPGAVNGRRLPSNPFRGDVIVDGCPGLPVFTSCSGQGRFKAGEVNESPWSTSTFSDTTSPPGPGSYSSEATYRNIVLRGLSTGLYNHGTECSAQVIRFSDYEALVNAAGSSAGLGIIVSSGVPSSSATSCMVTPSWDQGVGLLQVGIPEPDGTTSTTGIFFRTSDGQRLRTITMPPTGTTYFAADGSTLYVSEGLNGGPNITALSISGLADRVYEVGDPHGRVCGVSRVGPYGAIEVGDRLAIRCDTPGVGAQVGYLNTTSGALWLSQPMASGPSFANPLAFAPGWDITLSPDGQQLVFGGYDAGTTLCGPFGCWPAVRPITAYVDVAGAGQAVRVFTGPEDRINGVQYPQQ